LIPSRTKILKPIWPVYSLVCFIVYSWSFLHFLWRFPSWMRYSTFSEVLVMFSYMITINFLESLLIIFIVVVLCLIFVRQFTDRFVTTGTLLILTGLLFLVYRSYYFPLKVLDGLTLSQWLVVGAIGAAILLSPWHRWPSLDRNIRSFADNFLIFLYIAIPFTVASVCTVLFRNLF
jgi:hypothetical protein